MGYPSDPDEPTSELYRLTPPRRRSELREALDAATGADRDDTVVPTAPTILSPPSNREETRRRVVPFFGGVISNALGAILATATVALSLYLWAHFFHPGGHPPARPDQPTATATARR